MPTGRDNDNGVPDKLNQHNNPPTYQFSPDDFDNEEQPTAPTIVEPNTTTTTTPSSDPRADLALENERLHKLVHLLLLQQQDQESTTTTTNGNHSRLYRLDENVLNNLSLLDEMSFDLQSVPQRSAIPDGAEGFTTVEHDDFVVKAHYSTLHTLTQNLLQNLHNSSSTSNNNPNITTTTTTTTTTTNNNTDAPLISPTSHEQQQQRQTTFSANHQNVIRTTEITGPNDQQSGMMEVPGVPPHREHFTEELPAISSVVNDYFNATTSITIVTQQERILEEPTLLLSQSQHELAREIWHEALVLDVPRSDFWVVVPHDLDVQQRREFEAQQRRELLEFEGEDVNDYEDIRDITQRQLLIDNQREEFGVVVEDGFQDHDMDLLQGDNSNNGYVLLDEELIRAHLADFIVQSITAMPEAYTLNRDEILEALRVAAHIQDAHLMSSSSSTSTTAPTSNNNNNNTTSTTTPLTNIQSTTTFNMVAQARNNHTNNAGIKNDKKDKSQKQEDKKVATLPPVGPSVPTATLTFIQDCIKKGTIDSQSAIRNLVPSVCSQYSYLNWLYHYGSWAFAVYSWASVPLSIYRNPILSRTVLTFLWKGVRYAMVFFF